ncbi:MAG: hypothetical protein KBF81_08640, partial [Aquabacterium sp.]|nr:hypothetical protein [Aquabacterium sp.]
MALALWLPAFGMVGIHPWLSVPWVLLAVGLACVSALRPYVGLAALLGLLPVASLSVWSGWRVTDEFDVLLLLVLGGIYAHEAWQRHVSPGNCVIFAGVCHGCPGPRGLAWAG